MKSIIERIKQAHEAALEQACNSDCIRFREGTCVFRIGEKLRCYIYRMHYEDAFCEIPFEELPGSEG